MKMWWSRISNGTAILMKKEVRHYVRQRNNLLANPTKTLGIEANLRFSCLLERGTRYSIG